VYVAKEIIASTLANNGREVISVGGGRVVGSGARVLVEGVGQAVEPDLVADELLLLLCNIL